MWHLCADPSVGATHREVWVIANDAGTTALWHQRAGSSPEGLVVWDYHVVLATFDEPAGRVWDLDSTLGLDVPAIDYVTATFRPVPPPLRPKFRRLPADLYREVLRTDRRHMLDAKGNYLRPPPAWPPPTDADEPHNLHRLADMKDPFVGDIVDLPSLRSRLV